MPLRPSDVAMLRRHRLATSRPPRRRPGVRRREGTGPHAERPAAARLPRAAQRAGLGEPLPKLHDLRHAYASALLAAGLTVHAVAELLGHSSPALVMARYGHAYADEKAASAMALERLVAARG